MFESMQDLTAVLVGLLALWLLFGAMIKQERMWEQRRVAQPQRHVAGGRPRGGRPLR